MSRNRTLPPVVPQQSASGIAVDPQTLDRVIPASRRSDGSVRKEIKIRPGFTPQEDVSRFRGTRQAQMDANALPKGHILGWTPPPTDANASKPMSKSAKKNAKRREKKISEKTIEEPVKDSWEDDDEPPAASTAQSSKSEAMQLASESDGPKDNVSAPDAEGLSSKMEKLNVH
ncbi:hypothetical protein GYMLUDRAFT_38787 [Collybiopsis luxurians FD-317 M1]|nr:hypothetical protein GYMLUDRAFT_38787 [Collybiopsis luxurians FD-317 M1]